MEFVQYMIAGLKGGDKNEESNVRHLCVYGSFDLHGLTLSLRSNYRQKPGTIGTAFA